LEKDPDASATASPILNKGDLVQLAMKNEKRVGEFNTTLIYIHDLSISR